MLINTFKSLLIIVVSVFLSKNIHAQINSTKKSIYFPIDTFSTKNKKLYKIVKYSYSMFGSIIKFNYPCYYNGEYSPEFFQFKKTIKMIKKKEMKRLHLISNHDFFELICKYGVGGAVLFTDYDIYFVERLKRRKYLLYKAFSSPPPRIE